MSGVVRGITITARSPRCLADHATPCAWLPALAAITPDARSAGDSEAMQLCAPRILKLKTGW